ncbi:hypothetical protein XU18_0604 [Perkinsela sp. CCAP 1560/4]|nr:mitochondrial DNA polymerase I protein D [Perkinsela sp. CCAP 1560/4]KNH09094.1 hypothetical protein XU18_0604 [Perkinsela sp. CCAP 1560/4]|eukprot:KNH05325.1 mitochondrial DNA polymerase I protein D [Perkinsela sp. CCAP 1560/4]
MTTIVNGKVIPAKVVVESASAECIRSWGGSRIHLSDDSGAGTCLVVQKSTHRKGQGTFFNIRSFRKIFATHIGAGIITIETSHLLHSTCFVFITVKEEYRTDLHELYQIISRKENWYLIGKGREARERNDLDDDDD